jgi:ankyrin repeat and SOCS box protein 13
MAGIPLLVAAQSGDVDGLRKLIAGGLSVNSTNFDSVTPLHEACLAGRLSCVQLLLELGANVNARNIDGATPLCDACHHGNIECAKMLLEANADVNPKLCFFTSPLHEAVIRGNHQVVELLIERDANLEMSDLHYGRPLHVAARHDQPRSGKLLLQAGSLVNAVRNHETALHMAAEHQSVIFVTMLLDFGADTSMENLWGRRAIEMVPPNSTLYNLLLTHERNPPSLMQLCRLAIRKQMILGRHLGSHLETLGLPVCLLKYVQFSY